MKGALSLLLLYTVYIYKNHNTFILNKFLSSFFIPFSQSYFIYRVFSSRSIIGQVHLLYIFLLLLLLLLPLIMLLLNQSNTPNKHPTG